MDPFMAATSLFFGLQDFLLHFCARSIHIGVVVAHLGFFHHCADRLQISLIFVAVPSIVLP
jgi:hypothetical protein